ncbi:MAG TPA: RNA methyltransferase [Geobacteraceae bacterium]|nr:RNA methyltransferase [Geobacteraceae bacterium]
MSDSFVHRDRIAVVLVEPQNPGNIGMVCRAMMNTGLDELRLVNPCQYLHPEAHKFAVSAKDLLGRARVFSSLREALADTHHSVATTRRLGKYRREIFTPPEIVQKVLPDLGVHRVALVFGREDNGLTTEEVSLCRWHATIPTAGEYGSLNLSQAVLIFCYEFFKAGGMVLPAREREVAGVEEFEELMDHMEKSLLRIGYLNPQNPAHIMRSFRRLLARAEPDSREVALLRGMMSQIDWATTDFYGRKTP